MIALQQQLEKEILETEPLPMTLKRGRKAGSKVKKLKDGSRVVVTGRAATAIARKQLAKKAKPAKKITKPKQAITKPKRGPGRPRKAAAEPAAKVATKRTVHRRRTTRPRSGVIA